MAEDSVTLRPTGGGVGAFAEGIDLSAALSAGQVAALRRALGEQGVLFFRDQDLTPERHVALAERFGTININRFFTPVAGHPRIAEVRKEPDQTSNIGERWHTDHSYDQVPALGSILVARELPPQGGDTCFASMFRAYDSLSDGLKATLAGLRAVHSSRHVFGAEAAHAAGGDFAQRLHNAAAATQDAVHPVIIRHPISGRPALYVNRIFTLRFEGWSDAESAPLLEYLYDHGAKPEHTFQFQWRPGSIAFWDNRATWHSALNDYQGSRRLMHRITLEGETLSESGLLRA